MKKGYKLSTLDKNLLLWLRGYEGGSATIGQLHTHIKTEFPLPLFASYLKAFAKASGCITVEGDSADSNIYTDVETLAKLIAW